MFFLFFQVILVSYLLHIILPTHKMAPTFKHTFDHAGFKGDVEVPIGAFINGEWSASTDKNAKTIE